MKRIHRLFYAPACAAQGAQEGRAVDAPRDSARSTGRRWLACLALTAVLGLPGLAQASPGCQVLNGQSGTLSPYQYVQLLTNEQPVNQGDAVTLTTSGMAYYGGSWLQLIDSGGTVSGTESGSGAGADNLESGQASGTITYSITCVSVGATVSSVSPSSGPSGSTVTISGAGLWGASQVNFGGLPATNVSVAYGSGGSGQITATAPNGSGTVAITVLTDAGAYSGGTFTFVAPTASATSASVAFDSSNNTIPLNLSGNPTAVAVASAPSHGTAGAAGTSITYSPVAGYTGTDSFSYTASNAAGTSSPATVTITVSPPPVPTVAAVAATTAYNTATNINLTSAISGLNVGAVNIGNAPAHGTVSVSGETVTYTPSATFYGGTDSFTYTATNPGGSSAPATVTVTIAAPAAPTAAAKSASAPYNTATSIDLSGSISGVDITAVNVATPPTHGTVSVSGETVSYTPSSTFYGGTDSFTYTATNPGGSSAPATVTITVAVPGAPTVTAKSVSTPYDVATSIDLSGSISGADITAVNVATQPAHGTVAVAGKTVTYTPSSTFYGGTDSFNYTATNPGGSSAQATVTITVVAPAAPGVAAKSASTPYNTATSIDLSGSVTGVDITAMNVVTAPTHGTVSVAGKTVSYTPSPAFYGGTDSFTFTATNPGGISAPATVTVTVGTPAVPTVAAKSASTSYNTAMSIDLTGSISGVDITALNVMTPPAHGSVSVTGKTVTYTPSSTFYGGTDSFTYSATNPGGSSAPATVTMTVTPLAVPAATSLAVTTTTGTPVLINASAGAAGTQPITGVNVASQPAHGHVVASGEQITYTPTAGFTGTDSFLYQLSNHFGPSTPATITVTVTAAGSASASGGTITLTTTPGTAVSTNLASMVGGTYVTSTVIGVSPGSSGSTTMAPPTTLTFTPASGYHGLAQVTAMLTDAAGKIATVDVLVLVSSQPDPSKNPDVLGLVNAQATQAQRFAQNQLDNIHGRLESLHDGSASTFTNHLSITVDGKSLSGGSLTSTSPSSTPVGGAANPYGALGRAGIGAADGAGADDSGANNVNGTQPGQGKTLSGPDGLGVWVGGTANFGSFDAYRQAAGFDSDTMAINIGVDQRIGSNGLVGFTLGYNHDNSDVANDGTRSVADGYSAAVYASYLPAAQIYIDAVLGGGGLSFNSRRYDSDSGSYLNGDRNGHQWFGSVTAGYEYQRQGGLMLSPYLRLEQSLSSLNGYAEQGVVTSALTYGDQWVRTSLAVLGLRVSDQWQTSWGTLVPRARLELGHDFQGTTDASLSYAFIPSAGSWNVLSNPYSANGTSALLGVGLDVVLPYRLSLSTDYQYLSQPHAHDQMIRFSLIKRF